MGCLHVAVFDGAHKIRAPEVNAICGHGADAVIGRHGDDVFGVDGAARVGVLTGSGIDGDNVAAAHTGAVGDDDLVPGGAERADVVVLARVGPRLRAILIGGMDRARVVGDDEPGGDERLVLAGDTGVIERVGFRELIGGLGEDLDLRVARGVFRGERGAADIGRDIRAAHRESAHGRDDAGGDPVLAAGGQDGGAAHRRRLLELRERVVRVRVREPERRAQSRAEPRPPSR